MTHRVLTGARKFAEHELLPRTDEFDTLADEPPFALYRRFHQAGLAHWWLPEHHGGPGLGLEQSVDVVSELAYGDAGTAFTLLVPYTGSLMVQLFGTDELHRRYVLPMAASGGFCALAGSEHEAGSELGRTATTAALDGDHIVLNGVKAFSTCADFADYLLVLARDATEPGVFHTVLLPRRTPGVRIVKRWPVIGLRSSWTYEVALTECRVPADHLLRGNGLRILESGINALRILIGATTVGVARRIRDLCMDYAADKRLGDGTLLDNAVFAARLGQMEIQIDVMRNQCLSAARTLDTVLARPDAAAELLRQGTLRSAVATKMFCGQTGWDIASTASEMFGGLGYTEELPLGKLMRDIRYASILDGGDDVLRQLVYNRYVLPAFRRI
ncbi:acyl-CoA dehydrogenase family protein [Streptomyces sp. NPDC021093]|uniref:acyl-CoA dehydrogenase family protein n=1 Tax=Streptomyces sp. NPDC021093 TaxID=3365112 RepID=UPI0037B2456E